MSDGWSQDTRRVFLGTGPTEYVLGLRTHPGLLKCLTLVLFLALARPSALALDPATPLSQTVHTGWRIQDAAFSGTPVTMTRTTDGYLWIGTTSGLVRFDGVRFTPWEQATGQPAITSIIITLRGASDGTLWIGTAGSLLHWDGKSLTTYSDHTGYIFSIVEARDKSIWIGRGHAGDSDGPLCQVLVQSLRCHGADEGIHSTFISEMAQDTNGDFLIGTISTVIRWTPHSSREATNHHKEAGGSGIAGLIPATGGAVWVAFGSPGRGRGLQLFRGGQFRKPLIDSLRPETLKMTSIFRDSHGAIWCGTVRSGVVRIYQGHAEYYTRTNGLSGNWVQAINEDHEGNIWIATSLGIDRFRDLSFKPVYREDSNPGTIAAALPLHDGTVLFKSDGKLFAMHNGSSRRIQNPPGETVTSMFEDREHRLWVGYDDKLYLHSQTNFAPIRLLGSESLGEIQVLAESRDGVIWAIGATPEHRLYRISAQTLHATLVSLPAQPYALAADPIEGVWIGLRNGDVVHYAGTAVSTIVHSTAGQEWAIDISVAADKTVFTTTQSGLRILKNGAYVSVADPQHCVSASSLAQDSDGNLWVTSFCGVAKYSLAAIHGMTSNSQIATDPQIFDVYDGAQPSGYGSHDLSVGDDGRVWLCSQGGLSVLDPAHVPRNPLPPPVHIEKLIADRKSYPLQESLRLPASTRDLQIDYTALSFSVPQKVHFRYRLEGRDRDWQDPGNRRQVFYTDLRPGRYRFHVIASNNDGAWNTSGAILDFSVAASFYQTLWFEIVLGFIVAGVTWLLYSLRLRQVTAEVKNRLGERLNERERIARELHDTLLQGFQAVILHFQAASKRLREGDPTRKILEQGLDYADEVLVEGRDRVQDLRIDAMALNELSEALAEYGDELAKSRPVSFSMTVTGPPYTLDPIVRDEIYRIGREALGNAFKHSNGSRIESEIAYDPNAVRMRVRDNGDGIDSRILVSGRSGHWGLSGMRERAQRIGAQLNIWSRPDAGTELELILPAHIANGRPPKWLRWKWLKRTTIEGGAE